jgi:hypothetical protein
MAPPLITSNILKELLGTLAAGWLIYISKALDRVQGPCVSNAFPGHLKENVVKVTTRYRMTGEGTEIMTNKRHDSP